ncbi:N-methylglutamate dehydrogenase subunit B [Stella humosa]|uniref:N-methylglutamate dehydrogenase subunit B n=1 Tax=Stella humosa TaxID=94 RepID=A0A3N1KZB9_9PROT|nr:sarcosine oxidase subunit delta [Stella humosa]ROP84507.1 N-methylglutamate dehydrogenase subunit B [Stella humosa]BBK34027.1 sarcosine oxidase subunit delta [Stella humosa]
MHLIPCPWCGPRDEAEFNYRGDATVRRPAPDAGVDAFYDYVYTRANPRGWHTEWWHHAGGCRQFVKVVRHTMTHAIAGAGRATDEMPLPKEGRAAE